MDLILAIDHAPLGLENAPADPVRFAQAHGSLVSSTLCHLGTAQELRRQGYSLPVVLRLDGNETYLRGDWLRSTSWELFFDPSVVEIVNASGIAVNLVLAAPMELASLRVVTRAITASHERSTPTHTMVSVIVADDDPVSRRFGVRLACEYGADAVSVCGVKSLSEVESLVGVAFGRLLLGGGLFPELDNPQFVRAVEAVRDCGVAGLCVGKRLWSSTDPGRFIQELRERMD